MMVLVGQRLTTSLTSSVMPCLSNHLRAIGSSVRMLSRQVPMTAMSARWIEFMQSFGQPENLNLNLYGRAGRCMSSRKVLTTCRCALASSKHDCSQRAAPTQDIEVRTAGPAPPRSKPSSLSSSKAPCTLEVLAPWNMMSPD